VNRRTLARHRTFGLARFARTSAEGGGGGTGGGGTGQPGNGQGGQGQPGSGEGGQSAEGGTGGGSSSAGGTNSGGQAGGQEPRFTQDDLDRIVGRRVAEETAKFEQRLKDAQELAGKNETERLQTQLEQANTRATETAQKAAQRIARTEARSVARSLDVRPERLDAVLKQADLTPAIGEDGEVDDAKVQAAIEKVLADYPEWKKTATTSQSGGELNGGGGNGKPTFTRKQLEEMPPEEMAKRIDEINAAIADGRVTG
jgi:hypothetical protein